MTSHDESLLRRVLSCLTLGRVQVRHLTRVLLPYLGRVQVRHLTRVLLPYVVGVQVWHLTESLLRLTSVDCRYDIYQALLQFDLGGLQV